MLAELTDLWWLDWRGGSDTDLSWIGELRGLVFAQVWHSYKLTNVDFLARLPQLQGFMLHALTRVSSLPSLAVASGLRTVELSTLKSFTDLSGLAEAPNLKTLRIDGAMGGGAELVRPLVGHPSLTHFRWVSEIRVREAEAANEVMGLERCRLGHRENWPFVGLTAGQQTTLDQMRRAIRFSSGSSAEP
ncbi:MAG: hypothetical protein ACAH95_00230 [Fimbriimonas sp.]